LIKSLEYLQNKYQKLIVIEQDNKIGYWVKKGKEDELEIEYKTF